jgi:hypothetical protein
MATSEFLHVKIVLLINTSLQFRERLIVCCEKHDKKYLSMHKCLTRKLFIKIALENLIHY